MIVGCCPTTAPLLPEQGSLQRSGWCSIPGRRNRAQHPTISPTGAGSDPITLCPAAPLSPPGSPQPPTPCGPAADSSSPPLLQPEIKASAQLPSRCDSLFSAPGFSRNGLCYLWGWGPALLCAGIQTAAQTDRPLSTRWLPSIAGHTSVQPWYLWGKLSFSTIFCLRAGERCHSTGFQGLHCCLVPKGRFTAEPSVHQHC